MTPRTFSGGKINELSDVVVQGAAQDRGYSMGEKKWQAAGRKDAPPPPCPPSSPLPTTQSLCTLLLLAAAGPRALTQELHGEVARLGQQAPADDGLLGGVQGVPHDERDACGDSGALPEGRTAARAALPARPARCRCRTRAGPLSLPTPFLPAPRTSFAPLLLGPFG